MSEIVGGRINFFYKILVLLSFALSPTVVLSSDQPHFKQIPLQYIAALGDPDANSGDEAESWGLWAHDPGPRGCLLENFPQLKSTHPSQTPWVFDDQDWWLEEHGVIMEKPAFPIPAGQYVVTGGREVVSILTIFPPDAKGRSRWQLANGATLKDVTHLPCRAARYKPLAKNKNCLPDRADRSIFPIKPGATMPDVEGCRKRDYAVLFVIGVSE